MNMLATMARLGFRSRHRPDWKISMGRSEGLILEAAEDARSENTVPVNRNDRCGRSSNTYVITPISLLSSCFSRFLARIDGSVPSGRVAGSESAKAPIVIARELQVRAIEDSDPATQSSHRRTSTRTNKGNESHYDAFITIHFRTSLGNTQL